MAGGGVRSAAQAGILGTSALGSVLGERLASTAVDPNSPWAPLARTALQVFGGVAAPAAIAQRANAARTVLTEKGRNEVINSQAGKDAIRNMAEAKIRSGIEGAPDALTNVAEAESIASRTPGLRLNPTEMTGATGIRDIEKNAISRTPSALNQEVARQTGNRAALARRAEDTNPGPVEMTGTAAIEAMQKSLTERQKSVEKELTALTENKNAIAEPLAQTVSQEKVGTRLSALRDAEKGAADAEFKARFDEVTKKAEETSAKYDVQPLIDKVKDVLSQPILRYDEKNAPTIASRIKAIQDQTTSTEVVKMRPDGMPVKTTNTTIDQQPYSELKAMREAVNQDISVAKSSVAPEAKQQRFALNEIKKLIDQTIETGNPEVAKLYKSVTSDYATKYAPRFLRGVNAKMGLTQTLGDAKVLPEKTFDAYMGGTTGARRFVDLFGKNPEAVKVLEDGVLDKYAQKMRDGITDTKHSAFMSRYGRQLDVLGEIGSTIKSRLANMADSTKAIGERQTAIMEKQKELSRTLSAKVLGEHADDVLDHSMNDPRKMRALLSEATPEQAKAFSVTVMDNAWSDLIKTDASGNKFIDSAKFSKYLQDNSQSLRMLFDKAYGTAGANTHLANLHEIAKAHQILDRSKDLLGASNAPTNPTLWQKTGVTAGTIFSQWRGVIGGRTSVEQAAVAVGSQAASHIIGDAVAKAERAALTSPEVARDLRVLLETQPNAPSWQDRAAKVLKWAGYYAVGGKYYPQALQRSAAKLNEPQKEEHGN
jgi:hypothetical protein